MNIYFIIDNNIIISIF